MTRTLIIKPCTPNAQVIYLRTTEIEWTLYPFQFEQTWDSKAVSTMMGHAFHDIVQSCAHNDNIPWAREAALYSASIINNTHLVNFKAMLWKFKESVDDKLRFFVHNLENWAIIEHWLNSYTKKIATEVSMWIWVECWEYRVWLTGTCDILEEGWMFDPKYYSKLWIKDWIQEEYNKDNYMLSPLLEKNQWYTYPYLRYWKTEEDQFFHYDVTSKTKKLQHERIRCRVNMEWAEDKIKKDLINYFKIIKSRNV